MTIQEKLSSFDVEEPRLHVFHEGMFAKLYNESAFLFTEHVRRYKVNVTDCKRGRYYSLGFPFFALDEVFGENSEWIQTEISEDYRIYGAPALGFDAQEYDAWCREAERAAAEADARKAARTPKAANAAPQCVPGRKAGILLPFSRRPARRIRCALSLPTCCASAWRAPRRWSACCSCNRFKRDAMAHYQNLPVFKDAYDLLLRVYTVSRTFQRDFRYTIGEDLKKVLMEMMLCLFRANRSREKLCEVASCREHIEEVKIYLRILHDLKQLSLKQYVLLCERAEAISKQLAAWDKYLTKKSVVPKDENLSNDD